MLVACGAGLLLAAPAAAGTFPGKNGRIAYEYLDTIYAIALGDGSGQELVSHPDGGADPAWSPRGDRLVFVSERGGAQGLYVIDADGTDERRLTTNEAIEEGNPSWVDDDTVIFRADPDSGAPTLRLLQPRRLRRLRGEPPVNLTDTPGRSEGTPRFSPDGTMFVFGDPLGSDNLYVRAADGSGEITLPTGFFAARDPDWQALGGATPPADPDPAPAPDPVPTPLPDGDPPALRLTGKARQSSGKAVAVRVSCAEACAATVRGRGRAIVKRSGAKTVKRKLSLTMGRAKLGAGKARTLRLRFKGRKTKTLVRTTLRSENGRIVLTLRAVATDAAGNGKVGNFRVKLSR